MSQSIYKFEFLKETLKLVGFCCKLQPIKSKGRYSVNILINWPISKQIQYSKCKYYTLHQSPACHIATSKYFTFGSFVKAWTRFLSRVDCSQAQEFQETSFSYHYKNYEMLYIKYKLWFIGGMQVRLCKLQLYVNGVIEHISSKTWSSVRINIPFNYDG